MDVGGANLPSTFYPRADANLEGVIDPELFALAGNENRILTSHDFQIMAMPLW
jgi:hypothetical protein